jgi:gp32 DNA binding protein like
MVFQYKPRTAEAVKARAEQKSGNWERYLSEDAPLFTPLDGENTIRFLPPTWEDASHYGYDVWTHSNVGPNRANLLCLAKMVKNGRCAVCEGRARALRNGDEDLANELRSIRRVVAWLIDCKNRAKGPMIWSMPWTVDRDINMKATDRTTGAIYQLDNPEEGYNVYFQRKGQGRNTEYPGASIEVARNPTSIDMQLLDLVIEHPIPSILIWRDYDMVKALFDGGADAPVTPSTKEIERPNWDRGTRATEKVQDHNGVEEDMHKAESGFRGDEPRETPVQGSGRAADLNNRFGNRHLQNR